MNRLFAGAAVLIVSATTVAVTYQVPAAPEVSTTTAPRSGGQVYVLDGRAPAGTIPVVPPPVTDSTLVGEVPVTGPDTTSGTTSTTPAAATQEVLLVGGATARLIGPELARRVWPMKVRMITGEPVAKALELLKPTSASRVVVLDPAVPAGTARYTSTVESVVAAAAPGSLLWVEDWRRDHATWRVAIAAAAEDFTLMSFHDMIAARGWRDERSELTPRGIERLLAMLVSEIAKPAA